MKYNFADILEETLYTTAQVVFVLGKYSIFNNIVCDKLKESCLEPVDDLDTDEALAVDFGMEDDSGDGVISNSVDFNTFMDVIGVSSIMGRWYCRTELSSLTKKQQDKLFQYIKNPSANGLLVIVSDDWQVYKSILKVRILGYSQYCHLVQLSFPNRKVLKEIVKIKFKDKGKSITDTALDLFVTKMSAAYEEYDKVIDEICDEHKDKELTIADLKEYMKGIEHFVIEDFVEALTQPLTSGKTNNKKILRIMVYLEDEYGAKSLVYRLLSIIEESIEYRLLINNGYIPIGLNYFFKDVINSLGGAEGKYGKVNEWVFRKKANLASKTSLRDWEYMQLILKRAVENTKLQDSIVETKCKQALYELCTRSVLTASRLDNIIAVDNILNKRLSDLNKIMYKEDKLAEANRTE